LVLDAPARYLTRAIRCWRGRSGVDVVRLEKYTEAIWDADGTPTGIPLVVAVPR